MKLHLHVKTIYFDQIKAGTKRNEYRLVTPYWIKRLVARKEPFREIVIYNAYKPGIKNQLTFPFAGWSRHHIKHEHFGPDPVEVFDIPLSQHPPF